MCLHKKLSLHSKARIFRRSNLAQRQLRSADASVPADPSKDEVIRRIKIDRPKVTTALEQFSEADEVEDAPGDDFIECKEGVVRDCFRFFCGCFQIAKDLAVDYKQLAEEQEVDGLAGYRAELIRTVCLGLLSKDLGGFLTDGYEGHVQEENLCIFDTETGVRSGRSTRASNRRQKDPVKGDGRTKAVKKLSRSLHENEDE